MCMCLSTCTCVPSGQGGQERALGSLKAELQTVVTLSVVLGTRFRASARAIRAFNLQHSIQPHPLFLELVISLE